MHLLFYAGKAGIGLILYPFEVTGEVTGIGLTIAKRIVEVHKGQIWVESEGHGQGSTFCFTLPQS